MNILERDYILQNFGSISDISISDYIKALKFKENKKNKKTKKGGMRENISDIVLKSDDLNAVEVDEILDDEGKQQQIRDFISRSAQADIPSFDTFIENIRKRKKVFDKIKLKKKITLRSSTFDESPSKQFFEKIITSMIQESKFTKDVETLDILQLQFEEGEISREELLARILELYKDEKKRKQSDIFRLKISLYMEKLISTIFDYESTSSISVGYPYDLYRDTTILELKTRMTQSHIRITLGKLEFINAILNKLICVYISNNLKNNSVRFYINEDDLTEAGKAEIEKYKEEYNDYIEKLQQGEQVTFTTKILNHTFIKPEVIQKFKDKLPITLGRDDSDYNIYFGVNKENSNIWILSNDTKDKAFLLTTFINLKEISDKKTDDLKYTFILVDLKKWIDKNFGKNFDGENFLGKINPLTPYYTMSGKPSTSRLSLESKVDKDIFIFSPDKDTGYLTYDESVIELYNVDTKEFNEFFKPKDDEDDPESFKSYVKNIPLDPQKRLTFISGLLGFEKYSVRAVCTSLGVDETILNDFLSLKHTELKQQIYEYIESTINTIFYDNKDNDEKFDNVLKSIKNDLKNDIEATLESFMEKTYERPEQDIIINNIFDTLESYDEDKFVFKLDDIKRLFTLIIENYIGDIDDNLYKDITKFLSSTTPSTDTQKEELYDLYKNIIFEDKILKRNLKEIFDRMEEDINRIYGSLEGSGKPSNQFITNLLTIDGHEPLVIGTAGTGIKNYGDIDINLVLPLKYKNNILDIIHQIEIALYLIEIKIQNKDKKIKYKSFKEINPDDINKNTDFVKIDFKDITESSIDSYEVIIFLKTPKKRFIKESVKDLLMAKNYWKTLKRLFSIARQYEDTGKIKLFTNFIESDVGSVGRKLSLLEALDELGNAFDEKTTTDKLKNKFIKEMNKLIMKDRKRYNEKDIKEDPISWVNEKSREFLRSHNLI